MVHYVYIMYYIYIYIILFFYLYAKGFSTAKGSIVRSILFPKPINIKFFADSIKFVLILAAIGMYATLKVVTFFPVLSVLCSIPGIYIYHCVLANGTLLCVHYNCTSLGCYYNSSATSIACGPHCRYGLCCQEIKKTEYLLH